MNRLSIAMGLLMLVSGGAAMAQSGTNSSGNTAKPAVEAPVGHRQPRAGEVPNEKNISDPNNPSNKEDAELDRKIKSICRGC